MKKLAILLTVIVLLNSCTNNKKSGIENKRGISKNFEITDVKTSKLMLINSAYQYENGIIYAMKGSIINKTNKILVSGYISCRMIVGVNGEKAETSYDDEYSNLKPDLSTSNPWKPNTKRDFYIRTQALDRIYFNYDPDYVLFIVHVSADDPFNKPSLIDIHFTFDEDIAQYNIKAKWDSLKNKNVKK